MFHQFIILRLFFYQVIVPMLSCDQVCNKKNCHQAIISTKKESLILEWSVVSMLGVSATHTKKKETVLLMVYLDVSFSTFISKIEITFQHMIQTETYSFYFVFFKMQVQLFLVGKGKEEEKGEKKRSVEQQCVGRYCW